MYTGLPKMVAVQRFSKLPLVKSGLDRATNIYVKVKKSNRLIEWSLGTAEATVTIAIDLTRPTILLLDGPINLIDEILCKSLDMMEDAVPIIKSDPDKIYRVTKDYMSSVMEPVLKRADSVKEISNQFAITYSSRAAESLDNALTLADGYVSKYIPDVPSISAASTQPSTPLPVSPEPQNPTQRTIRHVKKFSRNLNKRLTERTLYEARELKKQGANMINVLIQLTDLLAKDPRAFGKRMKDLWLHLSQDEPENQEPPENLEQLIVMLSRESARRFVHVANFAVNTSVRIPEYAKNYVTFALQKYSEYIQHLKLNRHGLSRQADSLKSVVNDIFNNFFSLLKPANRMVTSKVVAPPLSSKNTIKKKETPQITSGAKETSAEEKGTPEILNKTEESAEEDLDKVPESNPENGEAYVH